MKRLSAALFTAAMGFLADTASAQDWSLSSCNKNTFPNIDKNGTKFPPGSCYPPDNLKFTCAGDTKIKIDSNKVSASTAETGYVHPPKYAVDQYQQTRWSSFGSDPNVTFTADLGEEKAFKRILIAWEIAHGKSYDILTTNDTTGTWTTLKEYRNGNGQLDTVDAAGKARFIRMHGIEKGADKSWGYSFFDFTVCADPSATSLGSARAPGAAPARWRVLMNREFQPVGVRTFSVNGQTVRGGAPKVLPVVSPPR